MEEATGSNPVWSTREKILTAEDFLLRVDGRSHVSSEEETDETWSKNLMSDDE